MKKLGTLLILTALLWSVAVGGFAEGRPDLSPEAPGPGHGVADTWGGGDIWDALLLDGLYYGLCYGSYYVFVGSYGYEEHLHSGLTRYPYYDGLSGNYVGSDTPLEQGHHVCRLDVCNAFMGNSGNQFADHLRLDFRPLPYFFLQYDFQKLLIYNRLTRDYSNFAVNYFNFCYDRLRFRRFNLGWSVGATYLGGSADEGGFTCGLSMEAFLAKPVSLYASSSWSYLDDCSMNDVEVGFKCHIKRYFWALGYEHLRIGSPEYNFVSLSGGVYLDL